MNGELLEKPYSGFNIGMFIYIHVPFCPSRCIYCDFFVVLEKYGGQAAYVKALQQEIKLRFEKADQPLSPIQTLYVGGGTPSLLCAEDYQAIFDTLQQYTPFAPNAEITLEANPKGMKDSPEQYLEVGFNRLSIGVQSWQDTELKKLSRIHTGLEAEQFIHEVHQAGFHNLSIDLMYGIPLQTQASWQSTLEKTASLPIQHVSMYGLKVEEGTPLQTLLDYRTYPLPQEDETVALYFQALDYLKAHGFQQYEFSNLAKPDYESKHNLNYWNNGFYYAFGPSAHGYVNHQRYENIRDLAAYLKNPLKGTQHPCPPQERLENALIFGLRKTEGVDIQALETEFNIDFRKQFGSVLYKFQPDGFLHLENNRLTLPTQAIPVSNSILAEFIF